MRLLRLPLAGLALAGFLLALWVHVEALRGIDVSRTYPQVWGLHIGIFVVFFPMVIAARRLFGRKPTMKQWRSLLPGWVGLLCAGLVVYAMLNFFVAMRSLEPGSTAIRDGQYVLQNHGHVERVITAQEYEAGQSTQLRMFSGHWMVFYFLSFAFFAFAGSRRPPLDAPRDGSLP